MEVISISLSDALLEQLDTLVDEHGYGAGARWYARQRGPCLLNSRIVTSTIDRC